MGPRAVARPGGSAACFGSSIATGNMEFPPLGRPLDDGRIFLDGSGGREIFPLASRAPKAKKIRAPFPRKPPSGLREQGQLVKFFTRATLALDSFQYPKFSHSFSRRMQNADPFNSPETSKDSEHGRLFFPRGSNIAPIKIVIIRLVLRECRSRWECGIFYSHFSGWLSACCSSVPARRACGGTRHGLPLLPQFCPVTAPLEYQPHRCA